MKEIFVPYEIATQLKEIGFDEPCMCYYNIDELLILEIPQPSDLHLNLNTDIVLFDYNSVFNELEDHQEEIETYHSAPTWEQVFKWFREKGIICSINPRLYADLFFYEIFLKTDEENKRSYIGNENMSYEECREKLILKMIKIYGNK